MKNQWDYFSDKNFFIFKNILVIKLFGDDNLKRFNEGDVVYFISSSVFIKKATVIRNAGGFCTIRFSDGNCGTSGTRVRESKLYRTEEEAKKVVQQHQDANKRR